MVVPNDDCSRLVACFPEVGSRPEMMEYGTVRLVRNSHLADKGIHIFPSQIVNFTDSEVVHITPPFSISQSVLTHVISLPDFTAILIAAA